MNSVKKMEDGRRERRRDGSHMFELKAYKYLRECGNDTLTRFLSACLLFYFFVRFDKVPIEKTTVVEGDYAIFEDFELSVNIAKEVNTEDVRM